MKKAAIILNVFVLIVSSCGQTMKTQMTTENIVSSSAEDEVESSANEKRFTENNDIVRINSAADFVKHLMDGEKLHSFFNDNWTFIYHEDNRCDGSTDGEKSNISNFEIDKIIKIKVVNDGDGWACDKTDPREFYLDFSLKEIVKKTFENPELENPEENIVHVIGSIAGTHYLILHYDNNGLIIKMEYRGEDPG